MRLEDILKGLSGVVSSVGSKLSSILNPIASGITSRVANAPIIPNNPVAPTFGQVGNGIKDFINNTDVAGFGRTLGKTAALPFVMPQLQQQNDQQQQQFNRLLQLAHDQQNRAKAEQYLTIADQLNKSNPLGDFVKQNLNETPGTIIKQGLGTLGTIITPGQAVAGAPIGAGLQALQNIFGGKPVGTDLIKGAASGFNMGAELGPISKVTSPLLSSILPEVKYAGPLYKAGLGNILKEAARAGTISGTEFGALNAAIADAGNRVKEGLSGFGQGFAFGAGGSLLGTGASAIKGLPGDIWAKVTGDVQKLHPAWTPEQVTQASKTWIRNPYTGKMEGSVGKSKPATGPEFIIAKDIKNRFELTNADRAALADKWGYGSKGVGLSIKSVTPEEAAAMQKLRGETAPIAGAADPAEIMRVADNLQRNNPGLPRKGAEAMAKDVIENRKFNPPSPTDTAGVAMAPIDTTGKPVIEAGKTNTTPQTEQPKSNIVLPTNAQDILSLPEVKKTGGTPTPQEVAATLPNKVDNFINDTLGYSTKTPEGGTSGANAYTAALRKGQSAITTRVENALSSENPYVRSAASNLQNFFRGLGMSPERAAASMELRGGIATANDRAYNVMTSLYTALGDNKNSLERINAVLDPSIAKTPVSFAELTPVEKQVYGTIREGLNLVHDTSYANGHISQELYAQNQGKYVPRLYDVTELPPEVSKFVTQGKKLVNDLYKNRTNINDWKVENSLNDPVYGLGKRMAQVQTNTAIKRYTDFLAKNPNLVSEVERPGFTKLSDSKAYGDISGKYVLNSAAEDLKGFFFANQGMQNLYDVFRAYDKLPVRQLQKKLLTVFNPTTNVGNIVSDQVFGFVTGVDPLTLNKNLLDFKANPSEYKQLSDYLMSKGVTATDITRTDFVNKMGQINTLAENVGSAAPTGIKDILAKGGKIADKIQGFYGGTDDVYKVSAFKALLDKGYSTEEATRRVADGFQNYANVGKFYDVWAKTPVVGSAFIKFQGDLIRIIKNGAVNNPLGLITFLGSLWGVARLSSKLSGETDQNRITRENRFAAPMIPGLNIPLTWQTPIGEINAARYISPFYANNDTTNVAKMLPFVPTIDPKKDVASNIAINANDPFLSTPLQLLVNRDFRGKPISDPNENKYQPSTLTSGEKLTNQAIFAGRAYTPPPVNSAIDVASAVQGKPNMYGANQTPGQAIARLAGIKVSQFGPAEADKQRANDAQFQQQGNDFLDKQISAVTKQQLTGAITPEQAKSRIDALNGQKVNVAPSSTQSAPINSKYGTKIIPVGGKFAYLDTNGNQVKADTQRQAEIGLEKIDFQNSKSNFKDLGDVVLRKGTNGNITVVNKETYNSQLNTAKLTSAKASEDFKGWLQIAKDQVQSYMTQLSDPNVDELDKIGIKNKLSALAAEVAKYTQYGGFKKGKKSTTTTDIFKYLNEQQQALSKIRSASRSSGYQPRSSNLANLIAKQKVSAPVGASTTISAILAKSRNRFGSPYKLPKAVA